MSEIKITALHREPKTYMPEATKTCTHVYVKEPKPLPLGPAYKGPYLIKKRLGESALELLTGHFVNGKERTEIRHWNTCFPFTPGAEVPNASRPALGRKPLNAKAKPYTPIRNGAGNATRNNK